MSVPGWLTKDYIEEVLKVYYNDLTLKIQNFNIKPAFGKGENYGSYMTKINLIYSLNNGQFKRENHLICKTSYEDDEFAKSKMEPYDFFNREMELYEQVLPKLTQLLKEIGDNDCICPNILKVDYKRQALIFEDLSVQGFTMADRIERLDMDHIKLVLQKLSKLHATSVVFNEGNARCLEKYDRGFFNKYTDTYKTFFVNNLLCCARYLQQLNDENSQKYAEKMLAMIDHYMQIGTNCFAPTEGHLNVLNHGDVWTNNLMFKYCEKTGKPLDVLLIDFQCSFWGSPSLDLHYFFNTSIKEPLRRYHQMELLEIYYDIFTNTLKKLNYTSNYIPNFKEFKLQADQKEFYAFHSSVVIQPIMLNQDPTDADYNSLMGEDDRAMRFKSRLYNNTVIQDYLKYHLPIFDKKGLLEINQ